MQTPRRTGCSLYNAGPHAGTDPGQTGTPEREKECGIQQNLVHSNLNDRPNSVCLRVALIHANKGAGYFGFAPVKQRLEISVLLLRRFYYTDFHMHVLDLLLFGYLSWSRGNWFQWFIFHVRWNCNLYTQKNEISRMTIYTTIASTTSRASCVQRSPSRVSTVTILAGSRKIRFFAFPIFSSTLVCVCVGVSVCVCMCVCAHACVCVHVCAHVCIMCVGRQPHIHKMNLSHKRRQ